MSSKKIGLNQFIKKLNYIIEREQFSHIIHWDQSKFAIQIADEKQMEQKILPAFFKHKKLDSFIRQLNLYGFKKVRVGNSLKFKHTDLENGRQLTDIVTQRRIKKSKSKHQTQDQIQGSQFKGSQFKGSQFRNESSLMIPRIVTRGAVNDTTNQPIVKIQDQNIAGIQLPPKDSMASINPCFQQYNIFPFNQFPAMPFYNPWIWHNNF